MADAPPPILRPRPISGYPEWLPEARLVELAWIDHIRGVFESYGFSSIETPSVEEIEVLVAKGGDADKEIYALHRLQAGADGSEPRAALHYDLTVPLARYVAQHHGDLVFPFKRYQIQRAWRGERPQEGRFREFLQCDLDVVDNDSVSLQFDAEIPEIVYEILNGLDIGGFTIQINNRKVLQGFYQGLGIDNVVGTLRVLDKLDKIGAEGVTRALVDDVGLSAAQAAQCLALAGITGSGAAVIDRIRGLGVTADLLDTGLEELGFVLDHLARLPADRVFADLSIARGFDYYTGTVYEGKLSDFPGYPSICSGGRYDNLASAYTTRTLPGVGMSIGLTRIFAKLLKENRLPIGPKCPTEVMVAFLPGMARADVAAVAADLRRAGLKVEMFHEPRKLQAQIRYAARKGIPYVWFPASGDGGHAVKALATGVQTAVDLTWRPPAA